MNVVTGLSTTCRNTSPFLPNSDRVLQPHTISFTPKRSFFSGTRSLAVMFIVFSLTSCCDSHQHLNEIFSKGLFLVWSTEPAFFPPLKTGYPDFEDAGPPPVRDIPVCGTGLVDVALKKLVVAAGPISSAATINSAYTLQHLYYLYIHFVDLCVYVTSPKTPIP